MASVNLSKGRTARLEGIPELEQAIKDLTTKVSGKAVKKVLMLAALKCRDEARNIAPKRTGLLKENIIAAYGQSKGDTADVIVTVKYGPGHANHAHLIEHGSSKVPAQPFLRPAVAATRGEMVKIIGDGFKQIIDEANGN